MADASTVWLPVLPSMQGFGDELVKKSGKEAEKAGKTTGQRYGKAILAGAAIITGAGIATGKALYNVGSTFDDMTNTIRVGTGRSGAALDSMVESAKRVGTRVPADFEDIGAAISDVDTLFDMSRPAMEDFTAQILEVGRITGEELDLSQTSDTFKAFGISAEDSGDQLDFMFQVSQASGESMNDLMSTVGKSAPAMKNLGFSFEETAQMAGSMEKAGLDSGNMMSRMSRRLGDLAEAGEDPRDTFERVIGEIDGMIQSGDTFEAQDLAKKAFGTRNAEKFVDAIEDGRLSLDDLAGGLELSGDTIAELGEETLTLSDKWEIFKNEAMVKLEPVATRVFDVLMRGMDWLSSNGVPALQATAQWVERNSTWLKPLAVGFAGVTTAAIAYTTASKLLNSQFAKFLIGLPKAIAGLAREAAALATNTAAKVASGAQTAALAAMYAGQWIATQARAIAGWIRETAVMVAHRGAQVAAAVATNTLAVAQRALNAVMRANPIGIIITILTALVAGIVVAYQKSETFRNIVQAVWSGIKTAAEATWNFLRDSVFSPLGDFLVSAGEWFGGFKDTVVSAWNFVVDGLKAGWALMSNTVLLPLRANLEVLRTVFNVVTAALRGDWDGVKDALVQGWQRMKSMVMTPLEAALNFLKRHFDTVAGGITSAWGVVKDAGLSAWNWMKSKVFTPIDRILTKMKNWFDSMKARVVSIWDALNAGLQAGWNWLNTRVFTPLKQRIELMKVWFQIAKSAVTQQWEQLKNNLLKPWNWLKTNVFDKMSNIVKNTLPNAFQYGKNKIKGYWDQLKAVAAKPINFVIRDVYNNGLRKWFNRITKFLKLDSVKLPAASTVKFADGSEDHRAQIAKAGDMRLWAEPETGGEAYIPLAKSKRSRSTDILGTVANNFGYNLTPYANGGIHGGKLQQFADGGFWGWAKDKVSSGWDKLKSIGSFLKNPVSAVTDTLISPVRSVMDGVGSSEMAQMAKATPGLMLDKIKDNVRKVFRLDKVEGEEKKRNAGRIGKPGGSTSGPLTAGGWHRPSAGPITSRYGARPGLAGVTGSAFHNGIDIAGGGPTYAARGGTVTATGWNILPTNSGIGILIGHGGGYETYYGHNPVGGVVVSPGDKVKGGQRVGAQGATGNVTGTHLHFGVRKNGAFVNPTVTGLFDDGGWLNPGEMGVNLSKKPEPVFSSSQWDTMKANKGGLSSDDMKDFARMVAAEMKAPVEAGAYEGTRAGMDGGSRGLSRLSRMGG